VGESALAVIRTSGNGAIDLVSRVFSRPKKLKNAEGNSIVHGWILDSANGQSPIKKIDEVLISVYRSPKTFTGEDGADICCHGGIAVTKAIMLVLLNAGFREALPGEFSFRAFMNGKIDLTRAESVMELVSAKTGQGREQAIRRLSGILENEINEIKNLLVRVLSGAEIYLDYSEDEVDIKMSIDIKMSDDEAAGRLPDRDLAESAAIKLKRLSELWAQERIYAEGALAVFAGRPNAGKSSLFNYLIREDRSIVTSIPGTTRDWIEAMISVGGIPLRIADTTGLRNLNCETNLISSIEHETKFHATGQNAADEVENIGIKRSFELLEKADLVLYVIDGTKGITSEDWEFLRKFGEKPLIVLWNKVDIVNPILTEEFPGPFLAVSAKTGEGIQELTRSITILLEKTLPDMREYEFDTGPGTARQKELIDTALVSVKEALDLCDQEKPLDIIAPLLRTAVDALGEITGEVSTADILETMFSRFCVGK
jgi:tRNA modification GTPase